jgi:hypothetical protein
VRYGRDIEKFAGSQFVDSSVGKRGSGGSGKNQSYMLDAAVSLPKGMADVLRPFPARLVGGPTNRQATDLYDLEYPTLETSDLVGIFEAPQNYADVDHCVALQMTCSDI